MSGRMRSMPGRSSPANATPRSTAIHCRRALVAEAVDREIHADLADAAERREHELVGGACHRALRSDRASRGSRRARTRRRRRSSSRPPSGSAAPGGPLSSSASKRPGELAVGEAHAHRLAEAGGAREPVGADGGKALAAVPLREAAEHLGRQRARTALRAKRCAPAAARSVAG